VTTTFWRWMIGFAAFSLLICLAILVHVLNDGADPTRIGKASIGVLFNALLAASFVWLYRSSRSAESAHPKPLGSRTFDVLWATRAHEHLAPVPGSLPASSNPGSPAPIESRPGTLPTAILALHDARRP